jgi:YVTN family beta-propeller protein
MAITPDGKTIYVGRYGRAVTPIATATNMPGRPISVSGAARAIAVTPDGKTAYVANDRTGTVTPIATATNTPGRPIKVGLGPTAIAITRTARPPTSPSGTG